MTNNIMLIILTASITSMIWSIIMFFITTNDIKTFREISDEIEEDYEHYIGVLEEIISGLNSQIKESNELKTYE